MTVDLDGLADLDGIKPDEQALSAIEHHDTAPGRMSGDRRKLDRLLADIEAILSRPVGREMAARAAAR